MANSSTRSENNSPPSAWVSTRGPPVAANRCGLAGCEVAPVDGPVRRRRRAPCRAQLWQCSPYSCNYGFGDVEFHLSFKKPTSFGLATRTSLKNKLHT